MAAGDLTDAEWELVGPLRSAERGRRGHENRRHLDGILWRAREGARWRAMPERYGKWNTVWRRFARWRDLGVLGAVFAALAESGLAEERVHLLRGDAAQQLTAFVNTNGFDVLVMGTVARAGI